ncbi:MAG TPA: tRNA preQ1(34) S-adenosylmethionine ribosyltransferase-isomerase QueA [Polyangiales bacterium]|nr:tRNA preQ1(34) S-adenosylmethionine ribosyltransferase-isomerase QueA [Polyangiales bacterium]
MDVSQLDYSLPEDLIAQAPLPDRDGARLLAVERFGAALNHRAIRDLPELLPRSLIVLNDTRVIPARLFAHKPSGGRVEFLLVERLSARGDTERWLALARTRKGLREGMQLTAAEMRLAVERLRGGGEVEIVLAADGGVDAALARVGHVPLPPYIRRAPDASDLGRYQTVFAAEPGAVAAPTAGLHLSERLIDELRERGHEFAFVTLHVGPGTFAPLRADTLEAHRMHAERFAIPEATARAIANAKRDGRPVLAVGTTVVRTLESAANEAGEVAAISGATSIFIYPPYRFRVVDALLTNFHLPRSTLLALVMAFAGEETVRNAYAAAVAARYRFFSYGDAMLLSSER